MLFRSVAVHIVDAEEVEAIHTEHHALEERLLLVVLVVEQMIAHSYVGTAIGGSTETVGFQFSMWSCKRQTIGEGELQRHLPFLASREIVGEIEVHRISLVGRQWDALAVELHLRIHQRETDPGICAWYKLAIELEVQACRMTAAFVLTRSEERR